MGSAQSHSLCYGGTLGHGYFRTPQTRKDKRKTKEFTYNYVDRIRLAENSLQDYKCPSRGSGWRQTRSVSHLDLATSCRGAATGSSHWPNQRQQLRHSRSLDYNQIQRCSSKLDDIAEFYWRIDPDAEFYEEQEEENENTLKQQQQQQQKLGDQKSQTQQINNEGHHHYCRGCNYADEKHHSAESINQLQHHNPHYNHHQQQQHHQHQQHQQQQLRSTATAPHLPAFEYDGEACSLRRSRSLAVIREETFSDLQITSANSSRRRSQLIPRARLVHRGFFQERDRYNCGNNKHHHHHHHNEFEQESHQTLNSSNNVEQDIHSNNGSVGGGVGSVTTSCDSHQHQRNQQQQQTNNKNCNQSHIQTHLLNHQHQKHHQSCGVDIAAATTVGEENYFLNLKRLDALAAAAVAAATTEYDIREQLHPWHNDKSDLESLNSDYFKNSLHQSHEHKQQHVDFEALEQAVNLLTAATATTTTQDKPRIYQSRRQQPRSHIAERKQTKSVESQATNGGGGGGVDSCPENSQSSVFPETTTSNSDNDQTDSPSLSEQEYDLTKIEEIFQKAQLENDEESFELISLTTTRTHFEENTNEEKEEEDEQRVTNNNRDQQIRHSNGTELSCESGSTLKRTKAVSENLERLIAYDSVYLSSEEGSEATLANNTCDSFDERHADDDLNTSFEDESHTLLHISIEDDVYEPVNSKDLQIIHTRIQQENLRQFSTRQTGLRSEIDKDIITLVKEKPPQQQEQQQENLESTTLNFSQIKAYTSQQSVNQSKKELPIYTQVLKIEHSQVGSQEQASQQVSATTGCVTSSAACKPKIQAVVDKRKFKRHTTEIPLSSEEHAPLGILEHLPQLSAANHSKSNTNICKNQKNTQTDLGYNPFAPIRRQATDSLYLSYIPKTTTLGDNQYHSLPDVNIGQSLKVSECIDAELRSSYNYNRYQRADVAAADARERRETKATNNKNATKNQQRDEVVTREEIYDSIKRFGRAHQRARQLEYKDQLSKEAANQKEQSEIKNATQQRARNETHKSTSDSTTREEIKPVTNLVIASTAPTTTSTTSLNLPNTKEAAVTGNKQLEISDFHAVATPLITFGEPEIHCAAQTEIEIVHYHNDDENENKNDVVDIITNPIVCVKEKTISKNIAHELKTTASRPPSLLPPEDLFAYEEEQPKEAPNIEVANFSKQIEQRAKEIRECKNNAQQQKPYKNQFYGSGKKKTTKTTTTTTFSSATFRINKQLGGLDNVENGKENENDESLNGSSVTNQFRIIVTDTQNNIIEEDSIDGNRGESTTSEAETLKREKKIAQQSSIRKERAYKETTTKSFITTTKVKDINSSNSSSGGVRKKSLLGASNSLKRKTSKSRRQLQVHQHHHHQQQQHDICQNRSSSSSKSNKGTAGDANDGGECSLNFNSNPKPFHTANNTNSHHQSIQQQQQHHESTYPKSKEHRVLSTQIYKARPVRVLSTNESFRKMSRPQILHVIENKRKSDLANGNVGNGNNIAVATNTANEIRSNQVENEYFKKVDAVRCYWSKLAKDDEQQQSNNNNQQNKQQEQLDILEKSEQLKSIKQQNNEQSPSSSPPKQPERRHFIIGAHEEHATKQTETRIPTAIAMTTTTTTPKTPNPDDFCSFMPSIEIVELGGNKKATIVSALSEQDQEHLSSNDGSTSPQFDHIRYKVLKSQQLLRSNMGPRTKKEAQFDGLIQYLQDYSFQELLSNNNVVIVEPVRTKVDPPPRRSAKSQDRGENFKNPITTPTQNSNNDESNAKAGTTNNGTKKTSGLRRHFFYQPVRVNRELYEEELPNPDTVRNVRKFFEENILPQPGQGLLVRRSMPEEDQEPIEATTLKKSMHKSRRKFRHLTIDTSYGHHHNLHKTAQQSPRLQSNSGGGLQASVTTRKWDTASLSSGISSGDLSSPCECNDAVEKNNSAGVDANNSKRSSNSNIAIVRPQESNGINVQDVIRRHNSSNRNNTKEYNGADYDANAATAATPLPISRSSGGGVGADISSVQHARCPRNTIVNGSPGNNGINREIYETRINAQQKRHYEMAHQKVADNKNSTKNNIMTPCRRRMYVNDNNNVEAIALDEVDNVDDGDDDNDTEDDNDVDYEDDDDDDICDSHYVSNEILQKIREYGSSVTYYGGRVMHAGSPVFQRVISPTSGVYVEKTNDEPLLRLQKTTCRVCQPNECPKNCVLRQNFSKQQAPNHTQSSVNKATTDGIKFKLVKSNSCSSRLELAGANDYDDNDDVNDNEEDLVTNKRTEVVRRMINRIEHSNSIAPQQEHEEEQNNYKDLVTINSQTPIRRGGEGVEVETCMEENITKVKQQGYHQHNNIRLTQVTVNNHINMPQQVTTTTMEQNGAKEKMANYYEYTTVAGAATAGVNGSATATIHCTEHEKSKTEKKEMEISFNQAQPAIQQHQSKRLSKETIEGQRNEAHDDNSNDNGFGDNGNSSSNTRKISRNKNVDLAFTLVKKQQQQHAGNGDSNISSNIMPSGSSKDSIKISAQRHQIQNKIANENETFARRDKIATAPVATVTNVNNGSGSPVSIPKKPNPNPRQSVIGKETKNFELNLLQKGCENDVHVNVIKTNAVAAIATAKKTSTTKEATATKTADDTTVALSLQFSMPEKKEIAVNAIQPAPRTQTILKKPQQIIVPVQIHCTSGGGAGETKQQKLTATNVCNSNRNTSSSNSSIDKSVVRHYVANDKSLFEKRKYDDIQFEEFEVYDPCKGYEKKLVENNNATNAIDNAENKDGGGGDGCDGGEDVCSVVDEKKCRSKCVDTNGRKKYSIFNNGNGGNLSTRQGGVDVVHSIDDNVVNNGDDDDGEDESVDDDNFSIAADTKSKSETDCYDSLDDKL